MHKHWDQYLNLKWIMMERKPKVVVECGAGDGALTRKIASLLDVYPFEFIVITDKEISGLDKRIRFEFGLSYEILNTLPKDYIDLCVIDTDHNYWTLREELRALNDRMKEGGLIALHDVETFYHDTGMAMSYWNGKPYPQKEIESVASQGSLGDAMVMFLASDHLHWKLFAYSRESQGAAILEKKTQTEFTIVVPGPGAGFAPKHKEELYAGCKTG
jgi:hypothetical protein